MFSDTNDSASPDYSLFNGEKFKLFKGIGKVQVNNMIPGGLGIVMGNVLILVLTIVQS